MEKPADNHDSHAGSDTDSEPIDWLEAEVLMLGNVKSNLSKDELDDTIQSVKAHFKGFLISREKLVKILGYAYEKFLSRKEDICEEIKNTLAEEIACHLISNRDIERYCFDEWKKRQNPRKARRTKKCRSPMKLRGVVTRYKLRAVLNTIHPNTRLKIMNLSIVLIH